MKEQNIRNYRRISPIYHQVLTLLTLIIAVVCLTRFFAGLGGGDSVMSELLYVAAALWVAIVFWLVRSNSLRVQDRVIRAEENLRHFALTGKLLDARLTISQIIALRFASDEEFPGLCDKAAEQDLSSGAIKQAVQHWRADHHRV
ncbi:MAG: hypothetical protein K0R75_3513 [Paenibacillaceae bacterium]|nr:hypothetical protein [Paenibacillaceae bacterium]